jgi:hypothetical protein
MTVTNKNGGSMATIRKLVLGTSLFLFAALAVNSAGPKVLDNMSTYAETHDTAPTTLAVSKHHNDPKNVQRRALQKQFAASQKAQRKTVTQNLKAQNKAALKQFRHTVTHDPNLSKNQQKSLIKAFAANIKADDKAQLASLKAQEKAARKANNQNIKDILRRFAG